MLCMSFEQTKHVIFLSLAHLSDGVIAGGLISPRELPPAAVIRSFTSSNQTEAKSPDNAAGGVCSCSPGLVVVLCGLARVCWVVLPILDPAGEE